MRLIFITLLALSLGLLNAATVHQETLALLTGPGDLDASGVISAGSPYDGPAGSSSDGVSVTGGIDFGDSYTQLNRSGSLGSEVGNLISLLSGNGYLAQNHGAPIDLPRHVRPDETDYSLEARVRSYLDVNCAYCHQPGAGGGGNWDGRHHLTLDQTGLINAFSVGKPLNAGDRLVIPGNVNGSMICSRAASANGYTRMPPLGWNVIDSEGVQLLTDWIQSEASALTSYDKWRSQYFGKSASGVPEANPDGDSQSNFQEYLFRTNPLVRSDVFTPIVVLNGVQVSLALPALPGRSVRVERSTNLGTWERWNAIGNDGLSWNPSHPFFLAAPASGPKEFFRFRVSEN